MHYCRVWEKAEFVEVEWTVGPIPINDDLGGCKVEVHPIRRKS
jgi:hypothetical protein